MSPNPFRPPPPKVLAYALGIMAGAGVLAACGHSAPTRFFTLDPVPPAAPPPSAYAGPPVKVLAVDIPPGLDREELVSEGPEGEVRVHDFEHWAAPLGQSARQILVQDLAARLPAGAVVGPNAPGGVGMATLSADVIAFQPGAGGGADGGSAATLQAAWSLTLPGTPGAPEPLTWRAPIRTLQTPTGGAGGEATAAAFSALMGQLADQVAADLPAQTARLQAERLAVLRARAAEAAAARAASHPRPATTHTTTSTTSSQRGGA